MRYSSGSGIGPKIALKLETNYSAPLTACKKI